MPPAPLYPLRFQPIFKPAIWGGRRLAEMFPGAPAEGPIGEAWVLSDHGDDVSVVADGPLTGTTLRELMRDRREELLGPSLAHHETFPLLLKFIDARENLSVQVHPNDDLAQELAGVSRGKSEAWVVLHAEPGSRIYAGLKEGVDRPRLEKAIAEGTVADCLHSFEPTVSDCVYLPAGTIHALGGGITIFEVQQTSDTTYRLFDWNRVDAKTGRPRDLHIEKALASTDFKHEPVRPKKDITWACGFLSPKVAPGPDETITPSSLFRHGKARGLVKCPYFDLREITVETDCDIWPLETCRIIASLEPEIRVELVPQGRKLSYSPKTRIRLLDVEPKTGL